MVTDTDRRRVEPRVMTVTGLLPAADLQTVDMHDHLLIGPGPATAQDPDLLLDDEAEAEAELVAFREAGGGAVVDAMPCGAGRDPVALERLSRATGVTVVATSGYHLESYYAPGHWRFRYPHDVQVRLLLEECRSGIDELDYCGPHVQRSQVRPGVLKVAGGFSALSHEQRRAIEVVAEVHAATGLPIIAHCEHGTAAPQLLQALEAMGVPADAVALNHMDRNPDPEVVVSLAERGAYLTFDGLYRERSRPVTVVLDLVEALVAGGGADQLMIGGDVARRSLRRCQGAEGIAGTLTIWKDRIERRLGRDLADRFFTRNPQHFLALRT